MIMGKNIKRRRQELGLTQAKVASKCHTTQSYYSQIESGSVNPSVVLLEEIAVALGLSASEVWEVK